MPRNIIPIQEVGARESKNQNGVGIGIGLDADVMYTLQSGQQHGVAYGGNNTEGPIDVATACNAHGGPHGRQDFESETFVAHPLRGQEQPSHRADSDTYVTHSLRAEGFDASEDGTGRGTPLVPICHPIDTRNALRTTDPDKMNRQGVGVGDDGDPSPTLTGVFTPAIAFDTTQITSKANRSNPKLGDPCHPLVSGAHAPAIATTMAVRRLTPRECERLQGFPDNYTRIPWRGKPAEQSPDGPRYKALGNSMAVPVMAWIGERIAMVETLLQNAAA